MPRYRRADTPGGTYFFTVVTYRRRAILTDSESHIILRDVINKVKQRYPFVIDAWVLLPDHIHCIWTLPTDDNEYAKRWGMIKPGRVRTAHREYNLIPCPDIAERIHRDGFIFSVVRGALLAWLSDPDYIGL